MLDGMERRNERELGTKAFSYILRPDNHIKSTFPELHNPQTLKMQDSILLQYLPNVYSSFSKHSILNPLPHSRIIKNLFQRIRKYRAYLFI